MKVYLGGSIKGGRDFEVGLKLIAKTLEDLGHEVLTNNFVVNVDELEDSSVDYEGIVERDLSKVEEADVFIAEVSQGSNGVGFEHRHALGEGKPCFLLRHWSLSTEATRSAFLSGVVTRFPSSWFAYYEEDNIRYLLEVFFLKHFTEGQEGRINKER